jgi:hypothetical protein
MSHRSSRKDSVATGRKLTGRSPVELVATAVRAGVARPGLERTSVPKPEDSHVTVVLEPSRHRLILERLHSDFYDQAEPSERIAGAVLAALHDIDRGPARPR